MAVLTVLPDDERVLVKDGETILEALHASGFGYRTGCKRGGCGICKVDLIEGSVTYNRPIAETVLSAEEGNRHLPVLPGGSRWGHHHSAAK